MSVSSPYLRSWGSVFSEFFEKAWDFLRRSDKLTPLLIGLLSALGVAGIYSSGTFRGSDDWEKQLGFLAAGAVVYVIVAAIPFKFYKDWSNLFYILGVALLIPIAICALLKMNLGNFIHSVNGSRRWYFLGSFGLQPSEFAKITTLIMLAKLLSLKPLGAFRDSWRWVLKAAIVAGVPWFLIVVEPDLGSSIVYVPVVLALLWLAGLSRKFFLTVGIAGALLASVVATDIYFYRERIVTYYQEQGERPRNPALDIRGQYQAVSWLPLKDYQRERLLSFVDPNAIDPKGIGSSWNVRQALISVGKGGLTGTGFNRGMQAKLGYLPELAAHNDFLFSVLAEEYGFAGCAGLISLYLLMAFRALRISARARDAFASLLSAGIAVVLMTHVLINVGMNIGLMPVTGLSLPFLSYGGSFVLSCFILFGLLQSVHSHTLREGERNGAAVPDAAETARATISPA
ncbi:MAG: FtsW/RodA/SpoVE family cell cycle protein [Candidatus Spyradosoma sp.]